MGQSKPIMLVIEEVHQAMYHVGDFALTLALYYYYYNYVITIIFYRCIIEMLLDPMFNCKAQCQLGKKRPVHSYS